MTGGGPANATMVLSMFTYLTSFVRFDFSLGAAASWMMLLMSMVICLFFIVTYPSAGGALMAAVVGSRRRRRLQSGLVYAALIGLALVFLFPLLWVLGLSLKTRLQVFASPPLFIWWPTLENYLDVLGRADFLLAFVNTLVITGSAVTLSLCIGVPAAYAFARFPFSGPILAVLRAAGHAHAAADRGAGADVCAVQQARSGHDAVQRGAGLHHFQPAAGRVDHARLFRGSAGGTGGKRLDRRRQPLSSLWTYRTAAGEAGHRGRRAFCACSSRGTIFCFPRC